MRLRLVDAIKSIWYIPINEMNESVSTFTFRLVLTHKSSVLCLVVVKRYMKRRLVGLVARAKILWET